MHYSVFKMSYDFSLVIFRFVNVNLVTENINISSKLFHITFRKPRTKYSTMQTITLCLTDLACVKIKTTDAITKELFKPLRASFALIQKPVN